MLGTRSAGTRGTAHGTPRAISYGNRTTAYHLRRDGRDRARRVTAVGQSCATSALEFITLSRLNGWPIRSPTDASQSVHSTEGKTGGCVIASARRTRRGLDPGMERIAGWASHPLESAAF